MFLISGDIFRHLKQRAAIKAKKLPVRLVFSYVDSRYLRSLIFHWQCNSASLNKDDKFQFKGSQKNNLTFSHLIFRSSSAAPESQNPQNNQLFLRFCSIGPTKSERDEYQLIFSRTLKIHRHHTFLYASKSISSTIWQRACAIVIWVSCILGVSIDGTAKT